MHQAAGRFRSKSLESLGAIKFNNFYKKNQQTAPISTNGLFGGHPTKKNGGKGHDL